MAYFNKIGLLILNNDQSKFMVCEKGDFTSKFIMPGGQIDNDESNLECLNREIKEELNVDLDKNSLHYIDDYTDVAAGDPTKDVNIKLYTGKIIGNPVQSQEIIKLHWIDKNDISNPRLSSIIRNKIIADLIKKGILK